MTSRGTGWLTGTIIAGAINNTGQIDLLAVANGTELEIAAAGATLSGVGQVVMGDDANNAIFGVTVGATLTNVDNTISGKGFIGAGQMTLINGAAGVIDASTKGQLVVRTTGAVLTTRLIHSMRRDGLKRGIVTLCIGGGQGIALALEILS